MLVLTMEPGLQKPGNAPEPASVLNPAFLIPEIFYGASQRLAHLPKLIEEILERLVLHPAMEWW